MAEQNQDGQTPQQRSQTILNSAAGHPLNLPCSAVISNELS